MRQLRYMADTYEGTPHVDVAAYFKAGRSILALKATEGAHHVDVKHSQRTKWAHYEGGTVLHYHFARPDMGDTPLVEAHLFASVVKSLWTPGDYLCCDIERGTPPGHETPVQWVSAFCEAVHGLVGATPIVYASESDLDGKLAALHIPGERYWVAKYGPGTPTLPHGKREWAWQFTDGELGKQPHSAPGIGLCDQSLLPLRVALPLWLRTRGRRRPFAH